MRTSRLLTDSRFISVLDASSTNGFKSFAVLAARHGLKIGCGYSRSWGLIFDEIPAYVGHPFLEGWGVD